MQPACLGSPEEGHSHSYADHMQVDIYYKILCDLPPSKYLSTCSSANRDRAGGVPARCKPEDPSSPDHLISGGYVLQPDTVTTFWGCRGSIGTASTVALAVTSTSPASPASPWRPGRPYSAPMTPPPPAPASPPPPPPRLPPEADEGTTPFWPVMAALACACMLALAATLLLVCVWAKPKHLKVGEVTPTPTVTTASIVVGRLLGVEGAAVLDGGHRHGQ